MYSAEGGSDQEGVRGVQPKRHFGKYRGVVSQNEDPKQLGRLRARVPEILADVESGWALPCVPYAGPGRGYYAVPAVGTLVWVEFEAGDVSRPLWTGCCWSEGQIPASESGAKGTPELKLLRSESGLLISLHDGERTLSVSDGEGENFLRIEVEAGKVTVQATRKVVVEAPAIELVAGAAHPLVFGDALLAYLNQLVAVFNTHVHPGAMAGFALPGLPVSPVPPLPMAVPAAPSLLSTKVTTG